MENEGQKMISCLVPMAWIREKQKRSVQWRYIIGKGIQTFTEDNPFNEIEQLNRKIAKMAMLLNKYTMRVNELEQKYEPNQNKEVRLG